jgi:hypothetical protein
VDTETFNQVLDLIQMLIIIVAMIFLYRSVPAAEIAKLFDRLETNARKTVTPVDDTMVGLGRLVTTLLTGQMPGQPVSATDGPPAPPQPVPVSVTGIMAASPAPAGPGVPTKTDIHTAPTQLYDESASAG